MATKRKRIIITASVVVVILILMLLGRDTLTGNKSYTVKKGDFATVITAKGEIQGKSAIYITFPDDLKHRDLRIHEFQIKDIIEEGKLVKEGDWIATLDINNINQQIQNNNDEMERRLAEFNDEKNDSAIELSRLRQELKELQFDLEYRTLDLEQSQYESPAYQRKMKVAYNKTLRQIDKKRRDLELRRLNLSVRTKRREDRYNYTVHRDSLLQNALDAATIKAPRNGMVMYARNRYRRKIRVGDNVSQWNPAIASLPDLSVLISETFVEEIQITKLQEGDSVSITVDAIPGKVYSGKVSKIANIGQELSGFDSKVFGVTIDIYNSDPALRPAMTSNNNIFINNMRDVLTIPRDGLFAENGKNFVYLKKAGVVYKQPVTIGFENETDYVITSGLKEDDKILLNLPDKDTEIQEVIASN